MSRTVTALFDSADEARAAKDRLVASNIDSNDIRIIDQGSAGTASSSDQGGGFFSSLKDLFLPDEDAHAYGEGIRRGSYLLSANVREDQADEAIRLLDEGGSVDFDERQDQWRNEGWGGFTGRTDTGTVSGAGMGASGQGYAATGGSAGYDSSSYADDSRQDRQNVVDEERIPVVEEELRVGKREVARGGARVRSYIREVPVHEQVSLREEHVSVERRPVDQRLGAADLNSGDLLRDRTIEMTETAEEAVIGKEARVREELVVRKTSEEHVEEIDDTVRRTEVEVDEGVRGSEDRSAFGSFGSDRTSTDTDRVDSDRVDNDGDFQRTDRDRF